MSGARRNKEAPTSLFDPAVVRFGGPRAENESAFCFYDRVLGERWDDYRAFVDRCYQNLPLTERKQTYGQWRGGQDDQLNASWWEMLLHEYLLTAGGDVAAHYASDVGARVDYRVSSLGPTFFVEAHRTGPTKDSRRLAEWQRELFAAINEAQIGDWRLHIEELSVGPNRLDPAAWVAAIEEWFTSDEPGDGELKLSSDGWFMRVTAFRRRHPDHPYPRAIQAFPVESGTRSPGEPVLRALLHKVGRYGGLAPLVLAIAVDRFVRSDEEVVAALYGRPVLDLHHALEPVDGSRVDCSLWMGIAGPTNNHVSAVVIGTESTAGQIDKDAVDFWRNPHADTPLDNPCPAWNTVDLTSDGIHRESAQLAPREFFRLPEGWGSADPYPDITAWKRSRRGI